MHVVWVGSWRMGKGDGDGMGVHMVRLGVVAHGQG